MHDQAVVTSNYFQIYHIDIVYPLDNPTTYFTLQHYLVWYGKHLIKLQWHYEATHTSISLSLVTFI